jgi:hypothetical protein
MGHVPCPIVHRSLPRQWDLYPMGCCALRREALISQSIRVGSDAILDGLCQRSAAAGKSAEKASHACHKRSIFT